MNLFVILVYKSVLNHVKKEPSKMWWKSATRKKWCQSCYQDAYSCIFILCILYQLSFQMQKIPWTMFSYYQNEISNLDMQLNIDILTRLIWSTFLHLKMGKSLHESETSNDNDIVYGVLVEILLELIIQNRAREKKENLCERNPK